MNITDILQWVCTVTCFFLAFGFAFSIIYLTRLLSCSDICSTSWHSSLTTLYCFREMVNECPKHNRYNTSFNGASVMFPVNLVFISQKIKKRELLNCILQYSANTLGSHLKRGRCAVCVRLLLTGTLHGFLPIPHLQRTTISFLLGCVAETKPNIFFQKFISGVLLPTLD